MRLLIVNAFEDLDTPLQAISESLSQLPVTIKSLDLAKEGFSDFMSEGERSAYHLKNNLVSPAQKRSAELVKSTEGLILCYPLTNDIFPAISQKAGLSASSFLGFVHLFRKRSGERCFKNLRHIHFIAVAEPNTKRMKRSNPSKSLLRAIRMNAGLKCRSSLSLIHDLESFGITARNNLVKGGYFK